MEMTSNYLKVKEERNIEYSLGYIAPNYISSPVFFMIVTNLEYFHFLETIDAAYIFYFNLSTKIPIFWGY